MNKLFATKVNGKKDKTNLPSIKTLNYQTMPQK
nr:MAG TPA: hypothetical protein [Caudoviricetes sp.]